MNSCFFPAQSELSYSSFSRIQCKGVSPLLRAGCIPPGVFSQELVRCVSRIRDTWLKGSNVKLSHSQHCVLLRHQRQMISYGARKYSGTPKLVRTMAHHTMPQMHRAEYLRELHFEFCETAKTLRTAENAQHLLLFVATAGSLPRFSLIEVEDHRLPNTLQHHCEPCDTGESS